MCLDLQQPTLHETKSAKSLSKLPSRCQAHFLQMRHAHRLLICYYWLHHCCFCLSLSFLEILPQEPHRSLLFNCRNLTIGFANSVHMTASNVNVLWEQSSRLFLVIFFGTRQIHGASHATKVGSVVLSKNLDDVCPFNNKRTKNGRFPMEILAVATVPIQFVVGLIFDSFSNTVCCCWVFCKIGSLPTLSTQSLNYLS